jgi:hypothetical protein
MRILVALAALFFVALGAWAQTTRPATQPSTPPADPEDMMRQLLAPRRPAAPLKPSADATDAGKAAPGAKGGNLIREGTLIPKRLGRLTRTADGQPEFRFESDGQGLHDPPMLVMPNLNLMQMENMARNSTQELKFRISGTVYEYRSRNYILIESVWMVEGDRGR